MLRALIECIQEHMHTINREIAVLRIKKKCQKKNSKRNEYFEWFPQYN